MKFNNLLFASLLIISAFTISCKSENAESLFKNYPQLETLNQNYQTNTDVATANELLRSLSTTIGSSQMESEKLISFLEYGYDIASTQNMTSRKASFLVPLIKEDFSNSKTVERVFELSKIMSKLKKESVEIVLSHGLARSFPSFNKTSELNLQLPEGMKNIEEFLNDLGTKIFDDPDNTGINRAASLNYVDACEAYVLVNPTSENAAETLFKAAEVAKSLRTYPKSLSLYDWIIEKYPNYEKTSTSLFLKGFIIENNLGNDEKAREVYDAFLSTYPDHELADDVEFLIENLGKTDEEILQMIESRRKDNQTESE